jgi:hypothetical protein
MNWKKLLIAFGVIYVVAAVLGFLIHGVLLMETYESLASIWRPDMESLMWIQWVTGLFFCFFFVFVFAKGYEGKGIIEGVRYGLIIWAFFAIPNIYGQYMVYPLPYSLVLKWLFSELISLVIYGVLAAVIYKPLEAKA